MLGLRQNFLRRFGSRFGIFVLDSVFLLITTTTTPTVVLLLAGHGGKHSAKSMGKCRLASETK